MATTPNITLSDTEFGSSLDVFWILDHLLKKTELHNAVIILSHSLSSSTFTSNRNSNRFFQYVSRQLFSQPQFSQMATTTLTVLFHSHHANNVRKMKMWKMRPQKTCRCVFFSNAWALNLPQIWSLSSMLGEKSSEFVGRGMQLTSLP